MDTDLLTVDHVRRHYCSETLMPVYRPGFRWYYLCNQEKHECFLIKIFDSSNDVPAKCEFSAKKVGLVPDID